MCRQTLRNEVPEAGNPLYLAFLIGRPKSTLNYDIFNPSLMGISLLSALTAGRVRPSTRTLFASSGRDPCVPSAFSTRAVACSSSGSSTGLSKQSGALITKDGSRQEIADIPRFAAPPGDAHRARGPRYWLLFQQTGGSTDSRSSVNIGAITAPVSASASASPWRRSQP